MAWVLAAAGIAVVALLFAPPKVALVVVPLVLILAAWLPLVAAMRMSRGL